MTKQFTELCTHKASIGYDSRTRAENRISEIGTCGNQKYKNLEVMYFVIENGVFR